MEELSEYSVSPHSVNAELSVLGAIFYDNQCIYQVLDLLDPDDFYVEANKIIYAACRDMISDSQPVDETTISERLKKRMDEIGGFSYLSELFSRMDSPHAIAHYGKLVKDYSQWRKLNRVGHNIINLALAQDTDPSDIAETMATSAAEIADTKAKTTYDGKELTKSFIEQLEIRRDERHNSGILTGLTKLDYHTNGLQKKDLTIIAARTSQGKTALITTILSNLDPAIKTLFFSIEENAYQITTRIASKMTRIDSKHIRSGRINDHEMQKIREAMQSHSQKAIIVDECPTITLGKIRAACKRMKVMTGLDLVIIDYIGLITHRPKDAGRMQRYEIIGEISRTLKGLAKELNISMVVLAQLNRTHEQFKEPQLHELRESGNLEQDADTVIFPWVEQDDETKEFHNIISIGKQRNGPVCNFRVTFRRELLSFEDYQE